MAVKPRVNVMTGVKPTLGNVQALTLIHPVQMIPSIDNIPKVMIHKQLAKKEVALGTITPVNALKEATTTSRSVQQGLPRLCPTLPIMLFRRLTANPWVEVVLLGLTMLVTVLGCILLLDQTHLPTPEVMPQI